MYWYTQKWNKIYQKLAWKSTTKRSEKGGFFYTCKEWADGMNSSQILACSILHQIIPIPVLLVLVPVVPIVWCPCPHLSGHHCVIPSSCCVPHLVWLSCCSPLSCHCAHPCCPHSCCPTLSSPHEQGLMAVGGWGWFIIFIINNT